VLVLQRTLPAGHYHRSSDHYHRPIINHHGSAMTWTDIDGWLTIEEGHHRLPEGCRVISFVTWIFDRTDQLQEYVGGIHVQDKVQEVV